MRPCRISSPSGFIQLDSNTVNVDGGLLGNTRTGLVFAAHVLEVHVPKKIDAYLVESQSHPEWLIPDWWKNKFDSLKCTCEGFANLPRAGFDNFPTSIQIELIQRSRRLLEIAIDKKIGYRRISGYSGIWPDGPFDLAAKLSLIESLTPPTNPVNRMSDSFEALFDQLTVSFLDTASNLDRFIESDFTLEDAENTLADFVTVWVEEKLGFTLDFEQAKAIACTTSRHSRIIARAGSGKTTVMAIRAVFLMEHCRVAPESLLLMAFNKSARKDLELRISKYLLVARELLSRRSEAKFTPLHIQNLISQNEIELPWIATFDAASRAIVIAENSEVRSQTILDETGQRRLIDEITSGLLKVPGKSDLLRKVMTTHFIDDWEKLLQYEASSKGSFDTELPRETLLGERVKSFGEKKIADWLFRHQIEYKYEKTLWLDNKRYSPDFTVTYKDKNFLIEYLGMAGEPLYDQISELKKSDYSANEVEVIYIYKKQIADGSFANFLKTNIEKKFGAMSLQPLSNDALWKKIREISESRFRKAVVGFVGQLRRSNKPVSYWRNRLSETLVSGTPEYGFSELAVEIAEKYDQELRSLRTQDFIGIMIQAISKLESNHKIALDRGRLRELEAIRFICMDEYQDFSSLFEEFVDKLTRTCKFPIIFAVGDGWQSINSHMGANPAIFERFENTWPNASKMYLTTNYRSDRLIVEAGNLVMQSQEGPGAKSSRNTEGTQVILDSNNLDLKPWEREQCEGDERTAGIVRLVQTHLRSKPNDSVVLLTRNNSIPWWFPGKSSFRSNLEHYLDWVKSHLPSNQKTNLSISTVHSYKGLESDVVILIDALDVSFPLIHSDSRFMSLFGVEVSEIVEEERRLFYVAVTRAKSSLYIITRQDHESQFINALPKYRFDWNQFQSEQVSGVRIICKGSATLQMKDVFKEANFRWDSHEKSWSLPISNWASGKSTPEILTTISNSRSPWIFSCRNHGVDVFVSIHGETFTI